MDRRKFIQNTTIAGIAATQLSLVGCKKSLKPDNSVILSSDDFLFNEITIDELQKKMKSGAFTARKIVEIYLARIEAIDKNGPTINAVIELNPDALAIADTLDAERKSGKLRGAMHGIPVLLKDNIDTGDKMKTTAGSLALEGHQAAKDAFIVQRLREAGAVILGKTNLSEWANFRSMRSSSGWSSRVGQTKNPCVLNRNPCGSSSGSGAAVAANLCTVAVGTETDGSVIAPASFCGIVGIKPTVGLLSRSGIIPISSTQDTAGPMARTVRDAAILLGAMSGIDTTDSVTNNSKGKSHADYTVFLDDKALNGKKIGVEKSFLKGHEGVTALYKQAIELLKKQGAMIVEVDLLEATNPLGDAEFTIMQYEFKAGLNRYLASANAQVKSLADVITFNTENAAQTMPYFQQEILELSEARGSLSDKAYTEALKKTLHSRQIIDHLMEKNQLDAIVGTSIGLPNCIDLVNGDYGTGFYFCSPAAMAGFPHITVPMGNVHELPVGLSLMAGAYQEGPLLGIAYAYEQASKHRKAPIFLETVK